MNITAVRASHLTSALCNLKAKGTTNFVWNTGIHCKLGGNKILKPVCRVEGRGVKCLEQLYVTLSLTFDAIDIHWMTLAIH